MTLVAKGDASAFGILVDRYGVRMRGLAMHYGLDRATAEDVVQDAFTRAWVAAGRFDADKAKFSTWLSRIVINRALDERRRKRPTALPEDYDAVDDSVSADDKMAEDEQARALHEALARLKDRHATALILTYMQERSNADSAAIMEMKIKAFESLLLRARQALKKHLMNNGKTRS